MPKSFERNAVWLFCAQQGVDGACALAGSNSTQRGASHGTSVVCILSLRNAVFTGESSNVRQGKGIAFKARPMWESWDFRVSSRGCDRSQADRPATNQPGPFKSRQNTYHTAPCSNSVILAALWRTCAAQRTTVLAAPAYACSSVTTRRPRAKRSPASAVPILLYIQSRLTSVKGHKNQGRSRGQVRTRTPFHPSSAKLIVRNSISGFKDTMFHVPHAVCPQARFDCTWLLIATTTTHTCTYVHSA